MVCLSIVSFNTKDLLRNCLKSIFNHKYIAQIQVWVVDNASLDSSVEMIKKEFPNVKLIENKKNIGFGAGHNLVFQKAKEKYYMVLNSDTILEENIIDEMVKFMEENKDYGISSCKVLGFDDKLQPNGGDLPLGLSLINWLFNLETVGFKKTAFHRNEESYYNSPHEVGWVSGNFMMIRREVIEKVGFFNEDYFMYFEDVELCFRTKKAGFNIMINPDVSIRHLSGGSLDDPKFRQWLGEYKGLIHFYSQQFGTFWGFVIKILVLISAILRMIGFALSGKLNYSIIYGKVILHI